LGDVHQGKGVANKVVLDQLVKRCVGGEAWSVVNFQQVDLVIRVDHEVEPQHLETHVVRQVMRLANTVLVLQVRLTADHCFDDDVLNIGPVLVRLQAHVLQSLKELR